MQALVQRLCRYIDVPSTSGREGDFLRLLEAELGAAGYRIVRQPIGDDRWNLLALPVALVLLVTGIGAPLVFLLVNAVLLGRELQDMVWLRHRQTREEPPPLGAGARLVLGGAVTALLSLPFVNFLAPVLGAAAATHLVHRGRAAHVF